MRTITVKKLLTWGIVTVVCMTIAFGCGGLKLRDGTDTNDDAGSSESSSRDIYLDFDDILIPEEMQRDKARTFVFRIGALAAGVLVLKGRVTPEMLITFFETNMSRDNWKAVSSFRSPRSLLLFEKNARWCIVTITEEDFDHKTRVEIWVSPKSEEIGSGLIN